MQTDHAHTFNSLCISIIKSVQYNFTYIGIGYDIIEVAECELYACCGWYGF